MFLKRSVLRNLRWRNRIETLLIFAAMAAYIGLLGYLLLGEMVGWLLSALAVIFLYLCPASPGLLLKAYRARQIHPSQAPELYQLVARLCERAQLGYLPTLYYLPLKAMNAFASGSERQSVIGLSAGLLNQLNRSELAGALAHEIGHLKHRDVRVMMTSEVFTKVLSTLSLVGQILLLLSVPTYLLTDVEVPWLALLLILFAPVCGLLLQLALSRRREYLADLTAAHLLGTPEPMIAALNRLDRQSAYWERMIGGHRETTLLKTHPPTAKRIQRLLELYQPQPWDSINVQQVPLRDLVSLFPGDLRGHSRYWWY